MLEQAVIDAQALKEAAIKSAEHEVLEKYSGEIKEAVETLLEQPAEEDPMEDPMAGAAGGEDPLALGGEEGESDEIVDKLSMKAVDGEDACACPCPDEEEVVELDLDALMSAMKGAEEEEEELMFEMQESDLYDLLKEDDDLEEGTEKGEFDQTKKKAKAADEKGKIGGKIVEEEDSELDEDIELDEDSVQSAIEEILKVDLENVPRGHLGTTHPTRPEQVYAVEVAAAKAEDTQDAEANEEFDKALKKIVNLEEQVKSLKSHKNRLVKEHNELKSVARQVSDKLTELNTANVKLVYQNRILESHSLNERQKEKLVEAVSNANSTEEAKVIYETLQDSLSSKGQNAPKNLNEAVSKNNRLVLKSNRKETQVSDSATERMKKLAGII